MGYSFKSMAIQNLLYFYKNGALASVSTVLLVAHHNNHFIDNIRTRLTRLAFLIRTFVLAFTQNLLSPEKANPAPRGRGIQVPGSLRLGIGPSILPPSPHHYFSINESTTHQWPRCNGAPELRRRTGGRSPHKFASLKALM